MRQETSGTLVAQRRPGASVYCYVFDALGSALQVDSSHKRGGRHLLLRPLRRHDRQRGGGSGHPFRCVSGHLHFTGFYKFGTRYYDAA